MKIINFIGIIELLFRFGCFSNWFDQIKIVNFSINQSSLNAIKSPLQSIYDPDHRSHRIYNTCNTRDNTRSNKHNKTEGSCNLHKIHYNSTNNSVVGQVNSLVHYYLNFAPLLYHCFVLSTKVFWGRWCWDYCLTYLSIFFLILTFSGF